MSYAFGIIFVLVTVFLGFLAIASIFYLHPPIYSKTRQENISWALIPGGWLIGLVMTLIHIPYAEITASLISLVGAILFVISFTARISFKQLKPLQFAAMSALVGWLVWMVIFYYLDS